MKAQKRDGVAYGPKYAKIKNSVTSCNHGTSQAKDIKNCVSCPKPVGYKKIKGAVSG